MKQTITAKMKKTAEMWGHGLLTHKEVSQKFKKDATATYILLARALKEIHYK